MNPITSFLLPLVTWVLMRTIERLIAMGLKGIVLYYITTNNKICMPIVLIILDDW